MSLDAIFNFVLASTINASIAGIIVFLTKKLTDRILPHKFSVLLWSIFIIKIFFPFGPESKLSVFNSDYLYTGSDIQEIFLENIKASATAETEIASRLPVLWLVGFIVMGIWLMLSNIILSLKLKNFSKPIDVRINNIFTDCQKNLKIKRKIILVNQCMVKGTSLFGLLCPKILITDRMKNLTDRELEYVFYHELSHYKRKDILTNYLIALIQAIHWFNPIIHIFAKFIRQDIELATDEKTISLIGSEKSKGYGSVLISMLEEYSKFPAGALLNASGSKNHLKKRIKQILCYREQGKCSSYLFLVLITVLSFATLTTSVRVKSTDIPKLNIKVVKKAEQEKAPTGKPKADESSKEAPFTAQPSKIENEQDMMQAPEVSQKDPTFLNEPMPVKEKFFPEAKANALPPGTDFDMMLSKALNSGRSREYLQNINLNSSCSVRDFNLKENSTLSLGSFSPDYNGNISIYINSNSSHRLNIMLLKDGKALLNASVKPSKTNSYSFTGLDKNDGCELLLTYKADNEYNNTDISGTVLIY